MMRAATCGTSLERIMDWFELYYRHAQALPVEAQVSILLILSWSRPVADGVVVVDSLTTKEQCASFAGRVTPGLELAVAAGWLAPLEHLADGSLRTTLTIPEGV
jgi:hypothetical protein